MKKLFLLFLVIAIALIVLPYMGSEGAGGVWYEHNLLEELVPDANDYYLNFLCAFSLFLPAIMVLESFFIQMPFQKKHQVLFAVQALGALLSWLLLWLHSSGPLWGPVSKIYLISTLVQVWAGMAVIWSLWLLYVSFSGKEKRKRWPFTYQE